MNPTDLHNSRVFIGAYRAMASVTRRERLGCDLAFRLLSRLVREAAGPVELPIEFYQGCATGRGLGLDPDAVADLLDVTADAIAARVVAAGHNP